MATTLDGEKGDASGGSVIDQPPPPPAKQPYLQSLKIFHKTLTEESLAKMFFRPLGVICLPPVLWAALVQSVTIGFLVAVSSNVAPAFQQTYGFEPYQVGLCFVSAIVGSVLGIPAGGQLGDKVADWLTKRNGGVRDPEMRLPTMMLCLVTTPLALVLYGVGIQHKLHWMVPTVGLGLRKLSLPGRVPGLDSDESAVNFSIAQGTNVCLVYVIDSYRPIAGEVALSVMGFKCKSSLRRRDGFPTASGDSRLTAPALFGFLLSFYTNPWVNNSGYQNAYGTMAGIASCILILWLPLYFWGKNVRHATWHWPVISYIHWNDDREVGE